MVSGCGGEPAALEVGRVGYTAEALGALSGAQERMLADLTALGLTVADGRTGELIEPFIERDLRSIVLQRAAMEVAVGEAGVDEAALRTAYAEDPEHELVVRHLVVLSERWRAREHRDSARARAEAALARARAGDRFEAVAAEYSDEPGAAERGGRLQPGREGSWVPEFWEAASSLEEGELSDVVETEFGFHVIRLEERRTVPFEEAREGVLERFVDLPEALGRSAAWVESIEGAMRSDTAAIRAWARGDESGGPLITWPDSLGIPPLTAPEMDRYAATFPVERLAPVEDGDSVAVVGLVEGSARTHVMLERARALGIEPSASQRVAIVRRWQDQVRGWAEALGFRERMAEEAVKEAALRALGDPAQSAVMARAGVPGLAVRLRQLYPVTRRPGSRPAASGG